MTTINVSSNAFSVEITATTDIAASPAAVWAVLTDTDAYPEWNPFVRRLDGPLEQGSRITVDLLPRGTEPQRMTPRIVEVEPGRSFTWLGHVGVPGILDGRHRFAVEATPTGSTLVQHERLSGALVPMFRSMLTQDTPQAFVASNEALAARVLA